MIDLEILTTKPDVKEMCERYWKLGRNGMFVESVNALVPWGAIRKTVLLEFVVVKSSIARDLRRRCPICGMPETLISQKHFLEPVTPRPPCDNCQYLQKRSANSHKSTDTPKSGDQGSPTVFTFPIGALVALEALSHLLGPKLRTGFSIQDCASFAPAHINRFLENLCAVNVIMKLPASANAGSNGAAVVYYLTDDPTLEHDFAAFTRLPAERLIHDPAGLRELWLDYAVAECMQFVFDRSVLFGFNPNPDDAELCSALRSAAVVCSIAEVCGISQFAMHEAARLIAQGSTAIEAAASMPGNILQRFQQIKTGKRTPQPIARSVGQRLTELGRWFHRWFDKDEHTGGTPIVD
jgi:hypothetical protein